VFFAVYVIESELKVHSEHFFYNPINLAGQIPIFCAKNDHLICT